MAYREDLDPEAPLALVEHDGAQFRLYRDRIEEERNSDGKMLRRVLLLGPGITVHRDGPVVVIARGETTFTVVVPEGRARAFAQAVSRAADAQPASETVAIELSAKRDPGWFAAGLMSILTPLVAAAAHAGAWSLDDLCLLATFPTVAVIFAVVYQQDRDRRLLVEDRDGRHELAPSSAAFRRTVERARAELAAHEQLALPR